MEEPTPIPFNEMERVIELSDFDLDYSGLENKFKDLTNLAAKVAGTEVSMINLIDTYTQWTIANHGIDLTQMPREDSVCQYTIVEKESFEVKDLKADPRFSEKQYVKGELNLKYYFGVNLKTDDGNNLGSLCVMDRSGKDISPEKEDLLKIIANEIVNRLESIKTIQSLELQLLETKNKHKHLAHDIRGPLGGIISLTELLSTQGDKNELSDILDFIKMINKAGTSLLDLATEIMDNEDKLAASLGKGAMNLRLFKEKLEKLYGPQALNKKISLSIHYKNEMGKIQFPKSKLLQISGNLISNAIKFTPIFGKIKVNLDVETNDGIDSTLKISVSDSGIGMEESSIQDIIRGTNSSLEGTIGESGYGFGLSLVRNLVEKLNGSFNIDSEIGKGSNFVITIPFSNQ
jgi:K+-sensing histidine kinase KdpD